MAKHYHFSPYYLSIISFDVSTKWKSQDKRSRNANTDEALDITVIHCNTASSHLENNSSTCVLADILIKSLKFATAKSWWPQFYKWMRFVWLINTREGQSGTTCTWRGITCFQPTWEATPIPSICPISTWTCMCSCVSHQNMEWKLVVLLLAQGLGRYSKVSQSSHPLMFRYILSVYPAVLIQVWQFPHPWSSSHNIHSTLNEMMRHGCIWVEHLCTVVVRSIQLLMVPWQRPIKGLRGGKINWESSSENGAAWWLMVSTSRFQRGSTSVWESLSMGQWVVFFVTLVTALKLDIGISIYCRNICQP